MEAARQILASLRINAPSARGSFGVPRRPKPLFYRSRPAPLSTALAALPTAAALSPSAPGDDTDDEAYDSADDEICGVDIVTSEPIRGADCRRLAAEGFLAPLEIAAAARTPAILPTNHKPEPPAAPRTNSAVSTSSTDGYDFFFGNAMASPQKKAAQAPQQAAEPLVDPQAVLRPAFRASPLFAEFQRQKERSTAAKILFLDEGGELRAVLAAELLRHMLGRLRTQLDVVVDCASLGPPTGRSTAAAEAALRAAAVAAGLPPSTAPPPLLRRFDEVNDAVRYDLILVMDRFDRQEVLREVSVLDAINPGGNYSGRVRLLGPYGMCARNATPTRVVEDISDPLYSTACDERDAAAAAGEVLQATVRELAFACRGLTTYLLDLHARCGGATAVEERKKGRIVAAGWNSVAQEGFITMRAALTQSLLCPLLAGELPSQRDRKWRTGAGPKDDNFTVRAVGGQRRVVRRPTKRRGFWKDPANVDAELKAWMEARKLDHLPTRKELRAGGASNLASAVDSYGGLAVFSARLGVPLATRRPNGYWEDFENLSRALQAYAKPLHTSEQTSTGPGGGGGSLAAAAAVSLKNAPAVASTRLEGLDSSSSSISQGLLRLMPSFKDLSDAGRSDLVGAIRAHGGFSSVASRLGLATLRRMEGWGEEELLAELQRVAGPGAAALPTRQQLAAQGRTELLSALDKLGGLAYFRYLDRSMRSSKESASHQAQPGADIAGCGVSKTRLAGGLLRGALPRRRKPLIEDVSREVRAWMKGVGMEVTAPTKAQLESAGRGDLWFAMQRCGGGRRVADHMGLEWVETRGRGRRKGDGQREDGSGSGSDSEGGARDEIQILDAYEEFVFV